MAPRKHLPFHYPSIAYLAAAIALSCGDARDLVVGASASTDAHPNSQGSGLDSAAHTEVSGTASATQGTTNGSSSSSSNTSGSGSSTDGGTHDSNDQSGSQSESTTDVSDTGNGASTTDGDSGSTTGVDPEDVFADIHIELHPEVQTMALVHWKQLLAAEWSQVQFRFEAGDWLESPQVARNIGDHREVIAGVPAGVTFEYKLVAKLEGELSHSAIGEFRNGSPPSTWPESEVIISDPDLADAAPWMLGSVRYQEASRPGPYYLHVIDRQGRIVWYRRQDLTVDTVLNLGDRIAFEQRSLSQDAGEQHFVEARSLLGDRVDTFESPHSLGILAHHGTGAIVRLFDGRGRTRDVSTAIVDITRDPRVLWDCNAWHLERGLGEWDCTINGLSVAEDHLVVSLTSSNTILELNLDGSVRTVWGEHGADWDIQPGSAAFDVFPAAYLDEGRGLLVMDHPPSTLRVQHFGLDRDAQTLERQWFHEFPGSKTDWPNRIVELPSHNVLMSGGATTHLRELTPNGELALDLSWQGDGSSPHYVGAHLPLDDLYALLGEPTPVGPPSADSSSSRLRIIPVDGRPTRADERPND